LAHLVAAASEGVGGVEEAGVCRYVVLGAIAEREGELDVAARRDAATPRRPFLELPPSGRKPEAERVLRPWGGSEDADQGGARMMAQARTARSTGGG